MPDPTAETPPLPPAAGGYGGMIATGRDTALTFSRLTAQQVMTLACVVGIIVLNGLVVWNQYDARNDRKDERTTWARADAERQRAYEDGRERDRSNIERILRSLQDSNTLATASMQKELMAAHAAAQKELLMHCTEESNKNRKALADFGMTVSKILEKKGGPEEMSVAPAPRAKINAIGQHSPPLAHTRNDHHGPDDPHTGPPR